MRNKNVDDRDDEIGLHGHHLKPEDRSERPLLSRHLIHWKLHFFGLGINEAHVYNHVDIDLHEDAKYDRYGSNVVIECIHESHDSEDRPSNHKQAKNPLCCVGLSFVARVFWWGTIEVHYDTQGGLKDKIAHQNLQTIYDGLVYDHFNLSNNNTNLNSRKF